MMSETIITDEKVCMHSHCRVHWSAIICGALSAVGLSFLGYLITTGLGLSAFTTSTAGVMTIAITGFIWLLLFGYFSMFIAGCVTGSLISTYTASRCSGALHGFIAWCLGLVIVGALLAPHHPYFMAQKVGGSHNAPQIIATSTNPSLVADTATTVSTQQTNDSTATAAVVAPNVLGIGVLALFFIFLAGALGSMAGGHFGVHCCHRHDNEGLIPTKK